MKKTIRPIVLGVIGFVALVIVLRFISDRDFFAKDYYMSPSGQVSALADP